VLPSSYTTHWDLNASAAPGMDYPSMVGCHPHGAILLGLDPDGLETGQWKLIADAVSFTVPLVRLVGPDHHLLDETAAKQFGRGDPRRPTFQVSW
jgi:hypothetical protein